MIDPAQNAPLSPPPARKPRRAGAGAWFFIFTIVVALGCAFSLLALTGKPIRLPVWAVAEVEAEPGVWEPKFYAALEDFKFLPAGRITAGAGTGRSVTLFNCFVMGTIPDSMGGIFDMLREAALTMQQGGGIGYDFSTIRPKGAAVKWVAADASGPLSFMDVWDAMCRTIMSAGSRRGDRKSVV